MALFVGFITKEVKYDLSKDQITLLQRMGPHKFISISIDSYAKEISKSRELARKELKQLVSLGILSESKKGRKFMYTINSSYLKSLVENLDS